MKNKKKSKSPATFFKVRDKTIAIALGIAIITILVYIPALYNNFVNYDDNLYVYENPYIHSLDLHLLKWSFTDTSLMWAPITKISHALVYALWGLNPMGHHLINILLHGLNTFLVVVLIVNLIGYVHGKEQKNFPLEQSKSFYLRAVVAGSITGLLFGIHPLRVESVAWVAERKDVLFAFFFLLSLISYLRYCGFSESRRRLYYLLTLVFFVLAALSKPTAVVLPLVLILMDLFPLERVSFRSGLSIWRRVLVEKLPFFAAGGAITWVNIGAHESMGVVIPLVEVSFMDRVLLAIKAIAFYLMKTIWPLHLNLMYGEPYNVSFSIPEYVGLLFFVTAITVLCIFLWQRGKKLWLVIWMYYIVMFLPVSVVKVFSFSFAHDRYTYMPSLGPFLLAGLGADFFIERMKGKSKVILFSLIIAALSLMAGLTIKQEAVWKNSITLWSSVVEHTPRSVYIAYYNRAEANSKEGRFQEATEDYSMAIKANPENPKAYMGRGQAYYELGKMQQAIEDYDIAINLSPDDPALLNAVYNNRAVAYSKMGRLQEAMEDYNRAIKLDAKNARAYINRGEAYFTSGRTQQAIEDYNIAINLSPDDPALLNAVYNNRAVAYSKMGRLQEAIEDYTRAIKLDAKNEELYFHRALLYYESRKYQEAIEDYTRAIKVNAKKPKTYINRGAAFFLSGRYREAIEDYTKAIEMVPDNANIYKNRSAAYERLNNYQQANKDLQAAAKIGDKQAQDLLRSRHISW